MRQNNSIIAALAVIAIFSVRSAAAQNPYQGGQFYQPSYGQGQNYVPYQNQNGYGQRTYQPQGPGRMNGGQAPYNGVAQPFQQQLNGYPNPYAQQNQQIQQNQPSPNTGAPAVTDASSPVLPGQSSAPQSLSTLAATASKTQSTPTTAPAAAATPQSNAPVSGERLSGAAVATSSRVLSFGGRKVSIMGVETPNPGVACRVGSVSWRCGERSMQELSKIAATGNVRCTVVGSGEAPESICNVGRDNVAALLVVKGMAISEDPAFRSFLNEARADRRGLWAGNDFTWRTKKSESASN